MLNSSSNGANGIGKDEHDYDKLKEKLKKVTEEMETLKRKRKNLKAEAKKAKAMLAKAGATRSTAENMEAYTEKQNDGGKVVDQMKKATAVNPAQLPTVTTFDPNDIVHVVFEKNYIVDSFEAVVESRLTTRKESYCVVCFMKGKHKFYNVAGKDMLLKSKATTPKKGDTVLVLMRPDSDNSEFVEQHVEEVNGTKVTVYKVTNEHGTTDRVIFDTKKDTFIIKPNKKRSADSNGLTAKPELAKPAKRAKVIGPDVLFENELRALLPKGVVVSRRDKEDPKDSRFAAVLQRRKHVLLFIWHENDNVDGDCAKLYDDYNCEFKGELKTLMKKYDMKWERFNAGALIVTNNH